MKKILELCDIIIKGFDLNDKFGEDIDARHEAETDGVEAAYQIKALVGAAVKEQGIHEVGVWNTENLQESVTIYRTDGGGLLGVDSSWLETLDDEETDRIYDPTNGQPLFFRDNDKLKEGAVIKGAKVHEDFWDEWTTSDNPEEAGDPPIEADLLNQAADKILAAFMEGLNPNS